MSFVKIASKRENEPKASIKQTILRNCGSCSVYERAALLYKYNLNECALKSALQVRGRRFLLRLRISVVS